MVDFSASPRTAELLLRIERADALLVEVESTQGSVPREAGAWMAVWPDAVIGTIGGGHLEFEAIATARAHLAAGQAEVHRQRIALGPSLGQCCGGAVMLRFELADAAGVQRLQAAADAAKRPVALFGGGHVGQALASVLATLPFALRWIDSREGVFPQPPPPGVVCEHSEPVQAAVRDLAPGSLVLIMSFSHAEDLDIVAACLARQRTAGDLPYIGLIGSRTKWATFRHRLEARGFTAEELAHVTCPIGVPGIDGPAAKLPEVIAVAVAAQLLQAR
jgi:xanthine dehydrogenase accessory factor